MYVGQTDAYYCQRLLGNLSQLLVLYDPRTLDEVTRISTLPLSARTSVLAAANPIGGHYK